MSPPLGGDEGLNDRPEGDNALQNVQSQGLSANKPGQTVAIYEVNGERIVVAPKTSFAEAGFKEREDLQRMLRDCIDVIVPDAMILDEEFGYWEDSRRRIDLLCIDSDGTLVVVELKRTDDGGHMELQAIRYAAMVSAMTFDQAVAAHKRYLVKRADPDAELAEKRIRDFLGESGSSTAFGANVRIVLASADFSKEITSAVLWLNTQGVDISCVRMRAHRSGERILLDVQQVIPLPEAAEFQIAIREKALETKVADESGRDFTRYTVQTKTQTFPNLPKRWLMFHVVREAIQHGIAPEKINEAVPWRPTNMFISKAGTLTSDELFGAFPNKSTRRYFAGAEEIFHTGNRTYALTNQWGLRSEEGAAGIAKMMPEGAVSFSADGA